MKLRTYNIGVRPAQPQEPIKVADGMVIELNHSEITILAKDGRSFYDLRLNEDGSLEVRLSEVVKHKSKLLDTRISVHPVACNVVRIERGIYREGKSDG